MKKRAKAAKTRRIPGYRTVPVSGGFMLTSMLGFLVVTVYTIYGKIGLPYGFAMDLIFVIMFIASVVSITPAFPAELGKQRYYSK
ncbi:hypothetical protein HYX10_05610 [Candidatus Woesearchaeota archaeon]|nr:hypothetical protein [Candidatus Woesearchaeota archaeon]